MKKRTALQAVAVLMSTLMVAACSGEADDTPGAAPVEAQTITWWHNSNQDPGNVYYETVARSFENEHPGVKIEITALQHQDMLEQLEVGFAGDGPMPDVYMERGGGELADHVAAGIVQDLSTTAADAAKTIGDVRLSGWQFEGKTYALPFTLGVVGFWYNKALFAQAGITSTPATMEEFYVVVDQLKAAGITPASVGAGDKWPAAHYWYTFALRTCSQEVMENLGESKDFSDPCFVQAGEELQKLIAAQPFNENFLDTVAQQGTESASGLLATGRVAMELAGHYESGVMQGLTEDRQGLGEDAGWFSFPAVTGGLGDPTAQLGGGDAWACSADAPSACADFVSYLVSDKVQQGFAEEGMGLPTNPAAVASVGDAALAVLVGQRDSAPYVQLYLDTQLGAAVGGAMNDEIHRMFQGQATPQSIVDVTQAAANAGA